MLASAAPEILAALIFVGLVVAAATLAAWLGWRTLRRRWRLLAAHGAVRAAGSLWAATGATFPRLATGDDDISRWGAARSRREIRRALQSAVSAVQVAGDTGGAVGELPRLCARLESAVADVEQLLGMGDRRPAGGVQRQVAEVLSASASIRLAAVTAASDASGPRIAALAGDAGREVECITEGVASARAAVPHPEN